MRLARRLVPLAVAVGGATLATFAAPRAVQDAHVFRAAIDLTSVTVTVRDKDARLVTGLGRDEFEVYEDGERQAITQFTSERVPVSLGLLLDTSDSMHGRRLADARAAVGGFLQQLDPADEFFLLSFNHVPTIMTRWTGSAATIHRALDSLVPRGSTAVYDAIIASLPLYLRRAHQRAALVVISDGADTASDQGLRDVRAALVRSDAFVYAIAIDPPGTPALNVRVNPQALREITDQSGGRTAIIHNSDELAEATSRIAEELNHQYLLGYSPAHGADGKYHTIRVRVRNGDFQARARNGYVAGPPRATPDERR